MNKYQFPHKYQWTCFVPFLIVRCHCIIYTNAGTSIYCFMLQKQLQLKVSTDMTLWVPGKHIIKGLF